MAALHFVNIFFKISCMFFMQYLQIYLFIYRYCLIDPAHSFLFSIFSFFAQLEYISILQMEIFAFPPWSVLNKP